MSTSHILKAKKRSASTSGENKRLRAGGSIPAVLYGPKNDPENLQFLRSEIDTLLNHAVGENLLVEVEIEGGGKSAALLQEVQHHPVTGDVLHVDLMTVSMDEEITTEVPVEPVGDSVGVKNFGGILEQNIRELEVECLPGNLPEIIHVDVSALGIGDSIHVSEIAMPDGVKCMMDGELAVFHIVAPRVSDEAATSSDEAAAPEVIKQKSESAQSEGGE